MNEVAIIGTLILTSIEVLKGLFIQLGQNEDIREIESGNVLVGDDEPFSFSVEPEQYRDITNKTVCNFHFTGRFFGELEDCKPVLRKLEGLLSEKGIDYNIDFQEEDHDENPIG